VLAGVGGHAAAFLEENVANAAVFPPCNAVAGINALHRLNLVPTPRETFISRYMRRTVMDRMADDMLRTFEQAG
jgi:hypothetical protein